ncbi:MAG TPA: hypothetical protein VJ725_26150 [Thermoanaerobaculia bacterium]|nr:hypothetical protein [Thermoanaerobaculia bacterium]
MRAHKLKVTIPQDHQLEIAVRLPEDFPPGPAEVIVLAGPGEKSREEVKRDALAVVEEIRSLRLTEEEEKILGDFEEFRKSHPVRLVSLDDE